jgi:alpha-L-fucosidase
MKKIEKLSTSEKFDKVVENLEKIMELLEDQKQPEGVMDGYVETVGTPHLESTTTYSNTEPEKQGWREDEELFKSDYEVNDEIEAEEIEEEEKQEEWREGLIDASYIYEGEANEDGSTKSIRTISFDYQKLENFISQLLSERTFTKEELETLKSMLEEEVEWELWVGGKELLEKISKLLKE